MITRQEIFDRAVRGLASQGWRRAYNEAENACQYQTPDGLRCAWGWVDPEGTALVKTGAVRDLHDDRIGLAADLSDYYGEVEFAGSLQTLHDRSEGGVQMRDRFVKFARDRGLNWPEDVP